MPVIPQALDEAESTHLPQGTFVITVLIWTCSQEQTRLLLAIATPGGQGL